MKTKIFKMTLGVAGMLFGLLGGLNADNASEKLRNITKLIDQDVRTFDIRNNTEHELKIVVTDPNGNVLTKGEVILKPHGSSPSFSNSNLVNGSKIDLETRNKEGHLVRGEVTIGSNQKNIILQPEGALYSTPLDVALDLDFQQGPLVVSMKISPTLTSEEILERASKEAKGLSDWEKKLTH